MKPELSLLIDAKTLARVHDDVLVLDARSPLRYDEGHLPNAVNLFIGALMQSRADGAQVLGPPAQLERVFGAAGDLALAAGRRVRRAGQLRRPRISSGL
jgi:3-mercaptopyruvate sulfurtransferase SseA